MDKEKQKDFARRVTQANKTELVSITCDIIIENIECASGFLGKGNTSEYRTELKQAQNFLGELIRSLDFNYPIAADLLKIYGYVQKILVASDVSGENRGLEEIKDIMEKIGSAFSQIAPQDTSGCVMENTQQIYAGLTYSKDSLNEADLAAGTNRGFLA